MGQVALTAVEHHDDVASASGSHDREFVSMSNLVGVDDSGVDEFVDVPTDVDMTGLDLDPVEIYQNLEIAAPRSQNT